MYGSHSGASRLVAVQRLVASWRVRYRRFHCIYPPELDLKKITESPTTVSYLDILITIDNGKYVTAVYNKRDSSIFSS